MITYKSLADDIKALFLTRNDSFGLKKSDELDLIVETSSYEVMTEESENMFKKFFRYATRTVSTSDKSDSGFVLIDARCNPDLVKEFNAIDPRGNEATCEEIYYSGCTYLIHSMNYQNQEKDEMKLYLTHLYKYIRMVVSMVMNKPGCSDINMNGAAAYILKYILDDTNFLECLKEEGYEFADILGGKPIPIGSAFPMLAQFLGSDYQNSYVIANKYKKVSEDRKLMQSDYITVLLDKCQILTVKVKSEDHPYYSDIEGFEGYNKHIRDGIAGNPIPNAIGSLLKARQDFKEGIKNTDKMENGEECIVIDSLAALEITNKENGESKTHFMLDSLPPTPESINKVEEVVIVSQPVGADSKVEIALPDASKEDLIERKMSPKYEAIPKQAVIYSNKQSKNNYKKNFNQKQNHRPGNR